MAEWENEEVFALIGLDFDPRTKEGLNVRANAHAALHWNLRKPELLLRFANYDQSARAAATEGPCWSVKE